MPRRTLVVAASVAVKWILPEDDTERALRLQESYQGEEIDLISPTWSSPRWPTWSGNASGVAISAQPSRSVCSCSSVSNAALGLAVAHGRPFYNCLYLAWALEQRSDLITADERFFNALGATFPNIRLLRALEFWMRLIRAGASGGRYRAAAGRRQFCANATSTQ